jgi:hypothetical protein
LSDLAKFNQTPIERHRTLSGPSQTLSDQDKLNQTPTESSYRTLSGSAEQMSGLARTLSEIQIPANG